MPREVNFCRVCEDGFYTYNPERVFCSRRCARLRWPLSMRVLLKAPIKADPVCWEWEGTRDANGYGVISWQGKKYGAHRLMWIARVGPIPPGLNVLHSCDNPSCVNYMDHLRLGTQKENMADMVARGRQRKASAA